MKHNWEYKRLGDVCGIQNGYAFDSEYFNNSNGFPLIRIRDVVRGYTETYFNSNYPKDYIVNNGDYLIGMDGDFNIACWKGGKALLNQRVCRLLSSKHSVIKYVFYFLQKRLKEINENTSFVTVKHLSSTKLLKELIPVPPMSVQNQIADELDEINELIAIRKEQLKELDNLAQSLFYDTFGDPITNPKGWEVKKLSEVCVKITDGTHVSPKFIESGIPFIFVSNIINNEITYVSKKFISEKTYMELWKSTPIEKGDIVYTSVGSYGNPAIVRDDRKFMFQRHIALLKPNSKILDSQFLKSFLMSESGKSQADKLTIGVAQKTLNLKAIKSYSIILPPLSLQQQFAAQVEAIEAQKGVLNESLKELQTLLDSRMDYWFN